jgi:hypothetical protein
MAQKKRISQPTGTNKTNEKHHLTVISSSAPGTPQQAMLDLRIEKQVQRDGIDMGVLWLSRNSRGNGSILTLSSC